MTLNEWAGLTLTEEDAKLSGPVLPGTDLAKAEDWCELVAKFIGDPLRNALSDPRCPDWGPSAVSIERNGRDDNAHADAVMAALAAQVPTPWESKRFSHAQAEIIRVVHILLATGRLRAFGKRARPGARFEWIPRTEWERLPGIDYRYAEGPWGWLFVTGGNAFRLHDAPAWCEVAVVSSPRGEVDWRIHRQAEIARQHDGANSNERPTLGNEAQAADVHAEAIFEAPPELTAKAGVEPAACDAPPIRTKRHQRTSTALDDRHYLAEMVGIIRQNPQRGRSKAALCVFEKHAEDGKVGATREVSFVTRLVRKYNKMPSDTP